MCSIASTPQRQGFFRSSTKTRSSAVQLSRVSDLPVTGLPFTAVAAAILFLDWSTAEPLAEHVVAVERARARGVPVIWVQHADDELVYGSPAWEWAPEL